MSILSRLFGKKATPVVAEPQKKTRKPWKQDKCAGSGQAARASLEVREKNGRRIRLGKCPECGHLGIPTKGQELVAAHCPKVSD